MTRTWSRTSRVIASTATALAVLTACGGGGDDTASKPNGPVTITFWGWAKGSKDVVDAFNASHTDIQVKFEEIPSGTARGYAKISNAVKAGNAPDLVSIEYSSAPRVRELRRPPGHRRPVHRGPDRGKLLPQAVELTTLGGGVLGRPLRRRPAGLLLPQGPLRQVQGPGPHHLGRVQEGRRAGQEGRRQDPHRHLLPHDPTTFEAMAWQAGAQWFKAENDTWKIDTTDPATTKVTAYWQGLHAGLVHKNASFSPEWTGSLKNGTTIGYLGASWGAGVLKGTLPEQDGKWAVAPIPTWDGKPASGMLGGIFAVTKDSKQKAAAVTFAEWMSTTEDGVKALDRLRHLLRLPGRRRPAPGRQEGLRRRLLRRPGHLRPLRGRRRLHQPPLGLGPDHRHHQHRDQGPVRQDRPGRPGHRRRRQGR
ncbi:sugar ABC transporter substrate-binding protein [Streptomyces tanashiensis]